MNTEFNQFTDTTPSLTLEPELKSTPEVVTAEKPVLQKPHIAEPVLTAEEQRMINDFAEKIDVENTAQILQYGAATQRKWRISRMLLWPMSVLRILAR